MGVAAGLLQCTRVTQKLVGRGAARDLVDGVYLGVWSVCSGSASLVWSVGGYHAWVLVLYIVRRFVVVRCMCVNIKWCLDLQYLLMGVLDILIGEISLFRSGGA